MNFYRQRQLSEAAKELIQFDADSIRLVLTAQHRGEPDVWLVDPDAYEKNGRVLRDSESPRMLAYSATDRVLYGTDGCNSCTRTVRTDLKSLPADELKQFAEDNELRLDLLERLVSLL
jgi:hypothetical protein